MPIRLAAPAHRPGGPDGQGSTRFAINAVGFGVDDQCALRPRDYTHLVESQDTRRARWGGYGPCIGAGDCTACPILMAGPRTLTALTDRILVRVHPTDGRPYLMNRPEDGWSSVARRWTWQGLARLEGWEIGRRHRDEYSDGFWLERYPAPP